MNSSAAEKLAKKSAKIICCHKIQKVGKKIRKVLVAKNYIKAHRKFWSLFTDTTNLGGKISIFKINLPVLCL